MNEEEQPTTFGELRLVQGQILKEVREVKTQTTKTNGRVSRLEIAMLVTVGIMIGYGANIVHPVIEAFI